MYESFFDGEATRFWEEFIEILLSTSFEPLISVGLEGLEEPGPMIAKGGGCKSIVRGRCINLGQLYADFVNWQHVSSEQGQIRAYSPIPGRRSQKHA